MQDQYRGWWEAFFVSGVRRQYIIVPESLSVLTDEVLFEWSIFDIHDKHIIFPKNIECTLSAFLLTYYQNCDPEAENEHYVCYPVHSTIPFMADLVGKTGQTRLKDCFHGTLL